MCSDGSGPGVPLGGQTVNEPHNPARRPLLPSRAASLFDSEAGSDVDFLVGGDGDVWRFPGHRAVLAASSPVFRAMLLGPLSSERSIRISDVDPRAFHHLLRFLYCEDVQLLSVPTALATLYAAHKYLVSGLVRMCVAFLDGKMCPATVLLVLQHVRVLAPDACTIDPWAPSAPLIEEVDPEAAEVADISHQCSSLLHNCLQMVDENADLVFCSEHVDELSADLLQQLAGRPTLALKSEMVLFLALDRWANRESKRRQKPLAPETRRALLGDARFSVRYLRMSRDDVVAGPVQSGLLEPPETAAILARLLGRPLAAPPRLAPLLDQMAYPRPHPAPEYIPLSSRSRAAIEAAAAAARAAAESDATSPVGSPKSASAPLSRKERRAAKEQQKSRRRSQDKRERVCTGSCFADAFFTTLACIFD